LTFQPGATDPTSSRQPGALQVVSLYVEGPAPGTLEARASIALKILAGLNLAGVIFAMLPEIVPISALHVATFNGAALALAVLYVAEAIAIDRGRPWAVAVVRPLLLILIASGIFATVIALGHGTLKLPFDAALAIWALLGAGYVTPIPRLKPRSAVLVTAVVPLIAAMLFGEQLFGWGGLLDVHEPDLTAELHVDCGVPGSDPPPTITLTYDWSWLSTSPLPNGVDMVVLGWTGADADGRPLYLLGSTPESGVGIYPGLRAYPSLDMSDQVASESAGSWHWGIKLAEKQYDPGHLEAQLTRSSAVPSASSTVTIMASYIHLGLWRHDAPRITCSW
jgi:hypothetical protein